MEGSEKFPDGYDFIEDVYASVPLYNQMVVFPLHTTVKNSTHKRKCFPQNGLKSF